MNETDFLADQFENHRTRLHAVAYRMLGSVSEADDAVQESWLRLNGTDSGAIDNLGGWLTTVVGRVSLDMLRSRRARREDYVGTWLPEPIVSTHEQGDPEGEAVLADSVGIALLVVLETLTPAERLAFVLHDMFGISFEEIAPVVDRTPAAARQLASRARRRVQGGLPVSEPDLARQREVVEAFLAASRAGDFEALLEVLDPDVVFRADTGSPVPEVSGAAAVAREILVRGAPFARFGRPAIVNGAVGVVVVRNERLRAVAGFSVANGRVLEIDVVANQEKLRRLKI